MQRRQPFGALPLLERFAGFEVLQFALPDFSNQNQRAVGAPERFFFSQIEGTLADLGGVVLDPDDVGPLRSFDVLNAQVAAQYCFTDFPG